MVAPLQPQNVRHCARTNGETRVRHVKLNPISCCIVTCIHLQEAARCSCRLASPVLSSAAQIDKYQEQRQEANKPAEPVIQESPGDRKDERSNYSDEEELPGLTETAHEPEELQASPEPTNESDEIQDIFQYLKERRKELRAAPQEEASRSQ